MGFQLETLDADAISRAQKQNVTFSSSVGEGAVLNTDKPLAGVTSEQRARTEHVADVLNIGAGTRCMHCGLLHFLWRKDCGACGKPMEYNLGTRDEGARL